MPSNPWVRSIRPHQWSKAALVIAAPFAAFHVSVAIVTQLAVAVALACVAASGTYLLNDAIDAPADRLHPTKRDRPIASGAIGRVEAVLVAVVLLAAAPAIGRFVNGPTGLALVAYVALTIAYSTKLKEIPIVDIVTIAAGFVVRVLIGAAAQVRDTVFGNHHIAQMARNSGVTVIPKDVGADRAILLASAAHGQNGACLRQGMRHGHKIVLPADAAHHLAVGQTIRHRGAEQSHHHGRIDESSMAALRNFQVLAGAV